MRLFPASLLVALFSALALGGPLDPPSGPIAPTGKTLSEVQPRIAINATNTPSDNGAVYNITAPGSYYLTGNINHAGQIYCIRVSAANVSIDLNGFTISGVSNSYAGIYLTATSSRVSISNGAITGFGYDGIDGGFCSNARYSNLTLTNNGVSLSGRFGLRAASSCVITNCVASNNTGGGFSFNDGVIITGCVASGNSGSGFSGGISAVISDSTATSNGASGFLLGTNATIDHCSASGSFAGNGFSVSTNSRVTGCVAQSCNYGFLATSRAAFTNCSAMSCSTAGIAAGDQAQVTGCTAASSAIGISAGIGCTLRDCTVSDCTNDNYVVSQRCRLTNCSAFASVNGNGFNLQSIGNSIEDCTASGNFSNGIYAQTRSRVVNCTTRENGANGIRIGGAGSVVGCFSSANLGCGILAENNSVEIRENQVTDHNTAGVAGIRVASGSGGRIEANNASNNYRNFDILSSAHVIVRNSSFLPGPSGGYNIVAGNNYGPLVTASGDLSTVANGSHPMANISR